MKKLSLPIVAAFTLLVFALPALAAPPACETSCNCSSRCNKVCSFGGYISSCGGYGECIDECLVAVAANQTNLEAQWAAIVADPVATPAAQGGVCQTTVDAR